MAREPHHLQTARETLMENSALAMEEQRIDSQVLKVARRMRHTMRRLTLADGLLDGNDREALHLADLLVKGCEMSLVLDVRDEEMLRSGNRALDAYSVSVTHKRHEAPLQGPRTHTLQV